MGNTYRSRLAEAYLKSLGLPGIKVASAGVRAYQDLNGPVTPYARDLIKEYGLSRFGKNRWTQLTQAQLDKADLVICMNRAVYHDGQSDGFRFPDRTAIWDIGDVSRLALLQHKLDDRLPHITKKTFGDIIERVNELAIYLRRERPKELVDVLNPDGSPTGQLADIDSIHTKGLWHAGVHAAIVTADRYALLQKRSATIIGHPNQWDFTMGGIVGAGERPEVTLLREIKEEMGLKLPEKNLRKLYAYRYNHHLPHYGIQTKVLLHTYLIVLPRRHQLRLQTKEVADARYLPFPEAAAFIRNGKSDLGETTPSRHYFTQLLRAAGQALS